MKAKRQLFGGCSNSSVLLLIVMNVFGCENSAHSHDHLILSLLTQNPLQKLKWLIVLLLLLLEKHVSRRNVHKIYLEEVHVFLSLQV